MKIYEVSNTVPADSFFAGPQVDAERREVLNPMSRHTIAYMDPQDFINVAEPGFDPTKWERVNRMFDAGESFTSHPFLAFDEKGRVTGHEGRHRMRLMRARGVSPVPVLIRSSVHRWGQPDVQLPDQLHPQVTGSGVSIPRPRSAVWDK